MADFKGGDLSALKTILVFFKTKLYTAKKRFRIGPGFLLAPYKSPPFDVSLHHHRFLMMQGDSIFLFFFIDSCSGLSVVSVICISIQHCIMLYIDIYIRFIVFVCVSLFSLKDYVYIDTDIRYLPLVFTIFLLLCL